MGMGNWTNLGVQNTPGKNLGGKWRSSLPRWHAQADSSRSERIFNFSAKIGRSNKNYKVSSKDFDQGKVAFYPMTLAQYRTYKLIPTTFLNIQTSLGPVSRCRLSQKRPKATLVTTTSFAMSARSSHSKLAWELMQV